MAQDRENRVSSAGDAIPMQKTGVTTYVAIAVGVLAIGGIVLVTTSRSDSEAEKKAAEIKAKADAKPTSGMTVKEQQEHMKMTARAFERAKETAAAKKAEEERQKAAASEAEAARVAAAPAAAGPAPEARPKVSKKAAKKQMDSLDSMGSDIASALK